MTLETLSAERSALKPLQAIAFLMSATFVGIGLFIQFNTFLNHDIAWFLYSSRDVLDGAVFGREIVSPNPPLIWYLSMPLMVVSELLGIHPSTTYRVVTTIVTLGSVGFVYWFIRNRGFRSNPYSGTLFLLVACYYLFIGSYRDFGQREYLALVLSLPYVCAAAARLNGVPLNRQLTIGLGLAAGIAFALKPHFLIVPVLVELAVILRSRSLRHSFCPENWALSGFVLLYVASLLFLTPGYLFDVVPMLLNAHWGYHGDPLRLINLVKYEIFGFIVGLYVLTRLSNAALVTVMAAAAAGFFITFFWQKQGYSYHYFPFKTIVVMILAIELDELLSAAQPSDLLGFLRRLVVACALAIVLLFNVRIVTGWYDNTNLETSRFAQQTNEIIRLIDRHAADGTFLTINTHPYPAFPIALHTKARFAGTGDVRFHLPAIARWRADGIRSDDSRRAEEEAWGLLVQELAQEPGIILVSTQPGMLGLNDIDFDTVAFYLEDPRVRRIWDRYREIEPNYGYRIFVRNADGTDQE